MDQEDFDMMPEAEEDEEELDPTDPNNAFAILERNYNKTIGEMEENPAYAHYLDEFTKLFDYLYETRAKNIALEEENASIAAKLSDTSAGLGRVGTEVAKNAEIIYELNEQVADSRRLIDAAHAREQLAQETIDNLRRQVAGLEEEMEFRAKISSSEIGATTATAKLRTALESEREKLKRNVEKLTQQLNTTLHYQEELETRSSQADLQVLAISQRIDEVTEEMSRYERIKTNLHTTVYEQREQLKLRTEEAGELKVRGHAAEEELSRTKAKLKEQCQAALKAYNELDLCNKKFHKLKEDKDLLAKGYNELKTENVKIRGNIQNKEVSIKRLTADLEGLKCSRDAHEKQLSKASKEPDALSAEQRELKQIVGNLEKEIDDAKAERNEDKQTIERYKREGNALNRLFAQLKLKNEENVSLIQSQNQLKQTLEREINTHAKTQKDQSRQILHLRRMQNRLKEELEDKTDKLRDTERNSIAQESQILSYQEILEANKLKLRMHEMNLEVAEAQRQRTIGEIEHAQKDNETIEVKLRDQYHAMQQMKHDIHDKDRLVLQMQALTKQLSREKDAMQVEWSANLEDTKKLRMELRQHKDNERELRSAISESDRNIRHNAKLIATMMNERQALSVQLMYRNDEIELLRAKVTVLQNVLQNGQAQYQQRLDDIVLMKTEIKRMRQEKAVFTNAVNNMVDLKQEVFHLERDLTRERVKNKMMEEEFKNPLNVHRWRKLEGTDPDAFQLLQKINFLQKQHLKQKALLVDRERQLKEGEKLYVRLRKMVLQQPTPDTTEKCEKLKRCVASNVDSMKTLRSEIDMLQVENDRCNIELAQTRTELNEVRRALLRERKKRAKDLESLKSTVAALPEPSIGSIKKFTGGGFRLSALPANPTDARNQ